MTATDADALLATIRANPADDAPRLVYADWLDEHGQGGRAELIRVQCARPSLYAQAEVFASGRWSLAGRKSNPSLAAALEGELERVAGGRAVGLVAVFRRGFVAEIRATLATLIGGVCGRCEGSGGRRITGNAYDRFTCQKCDGTGRTPGLRDLVRREPVEVVLVTDREPVRLSGGGFEFFVTDRPGVPNAIPWDLAEANARGLCETFPTAAAAHAALSRAVLAHLRADG